MTQAELAAKVGVTVGYIGKIEIGRGAGLNTLVKIADILGIPGEEVLKSDQTLVTIFNEQALDGSKYNSEFINLSPKLKKLLLKLAPIIEEFLQKHG